MNMPTWTKALFAAALSGFAGAALDALTKSVAGGTPDYRGAVHAGIAAAVIGMLAYLKASPLTPPSDPPVGGSSFRGGSSFAIIGALLLVGVGASTACDWKKAERPLVSAGYNFQITDLATAKVIAAVKTYKPGSISNDTARKYFNALQKTSQIGQGFSLAIDQTVEINPQSKVQLLAEADRYLAQVDATIAVIDPADTKIREWLLVARATASAFKIAIAATKVVTPTARVIADVSKAKTTAVATAGSRDINDTVNLINALGAISADFSADVLAQKGLDAAALRTQRDAKYQAVQSFISAELAKL